MNTSLVTVALHVIQVAIMVAQMAKHVIQSVIAPALRAAIHLSTHASPAGVVQHSRPLILIKQRDSVPVRVNTQANQIIVGLVVQLDVMFAMRNIRIYVCTARKGISWRIQTLYQVGA